jgi:Na+/H+ antiporter NhaC
MNHKRGFPAFIAAFVFIFFFGFVWHGMLMKSAYMDTSALWRPEADFNNHFWILILGHAVLAFAFTGLYVCKVGVNSASTGFGYGIVFGIFNWGIVLIRYAVEPLTTQILCMWLVGDIISFAIMGAIVGAIYKPKTAVA